MRRRKFPNLTNKEIKEEIKESKHNMRNLDDEIYNLRCSLEIYQDKIKEGKRHTHEERDEMLANKSLVNQLKPHLTQYKKIINDYEKELEIVNNAI